MSAGSELAGPDLRGAHIRHHLRGHAHGRFGRRILRIFLISLAMLIGLSVAISAVAAPHVAAPCSVAKPCGRPVSLPQPLVNQSIYRSSRYGFTLEYPGDELSVSRSNSTGVTLDASLKNGDDVAFVVTGYPATSPAGAIGEALSGLDGVNGLALDNDPAVQVLGGGVGHHPGAGEVWGGTLVAPQGVSQQVDVAAEAGTSGGVTIVALVVAAASDSGPDSAAWSLADSLVNSVRWSGQ